MQKKNISLDELKSIQLDILSVIDRFCRENNIKYSLGYGSMLGAARHQGYIPWDDDVDIILLRSEYEKLLSSFPKELDNVKIASLQTDIKWDRAFAKAYDCRTELQDAGNKYRIGVGIDIYPIDSVPDDETQWKQYERKRRLCQNLYEWKISMIFRKGRSIWKYAFLPFVKLILLPFSVRNMSLNIEQYALKYSHVKSSYVSECSQGLYKYKRFRRSVFDTYVEVPFESHLFYAIKNWDEYLSTIYGDWRKLPPLDKQKPHHNFEAWWK
ncbi:MAG: LicD family protein [Salinivirgaceae bacterium]|nr:LicD family protein [Salinivirgaceae bacterium]